MKCGPIALLLTALIAPGSSHAGDVDELEIVGFSDDASLFAYWTFGVFDGSGFAHAELNVYSASDGKRVEKESRKLTLDDVGAKRAALDKLKASETGHLKALKLGADSGVEMYKSGTASRTSFAVAGQPVSLLLEVKKGEVNTETGVPADHAALKLETQGGAQVIYAGAGGFNYSLNSVRLANDGRTLAALLKHSERGFEGPDRRFICALTRLR